MLKSSGASMLIVNDTGIFLTNGTASITLVGATVAVNETALTVNDHARLPAAHRRGRPVHPRSPVDRHAVGPAGASSAGSQSPRSPACGP